MTFWATLLVGVISAVSFTMLFLGIECLLDWLSERKEARQKTDFDLARKERQAAEQIAAVTLEAQMRILGEVMKRNYPGHVDGEVLGVDDEPWKPRWTA